MSTQLALSDELTVAQIEGWGEAKLGVTSVASLELDMSNVTFAHSEALMLLLAIIQRRSKLNLTTTLVFPRSKHAISFLKRWRFHDAIETLTGLPISNFVKKRVADITWLEDQETTGKYEPSTVEIDGEKVKLYSSSFVDTLFYEFDAFTDARDKSTGVSKEQKSGPIIREQYELYNSMHVQSVLSRKFDGPNRSSITKTLGELINNAFEHPGATTLIVMSYCPKESEYIPEEYVELCVFDNGKSIPETLLDAKSNGVDIYSSIPMKDISVSIECNFNGVERIIDRDYFKSKSGDTQISALEMLISSIFPGVSSRFRNSKKLEHADMTEFRGKLRGQGNGLFIAAYVACHTGKGQLQIRTAQYLMLIKANFEKTDRNNSLFCFKVEVSNVLVADLAVDGNIVTAKLFPNRV